MANQSLSCDQVFSFVNAGYATSGTVNILNILKWIETKGWFSNPTVNEVQFGFEITSSSGGLNFIANSLTISYS